MRISEIHITRYGPLKDIHLEFSSNFELIYGPNESGKTLFVDAVLKMLLGRGAKKYSDIDRVDELPEGYPIIEVDGKEIKLERGETLQTVFQNHSECVKINADELRNIFVVRDSDLHFGQSIAFYGNLTERLSGTRSTEIKHIIEELREEGRLTPTGMLADSQDMGYPNRRMRRAENLSRNFSEYSETASSNGLIDIEAELFGLQNNKRELTEQIDRLEKAETRYYIEEASRLLKEAREYVDALSDFDMARIQETQYEVKKLKSKSSEQATLKWKRKNTTQLSIISLIMSLVSVISIYGLFGDTFWGVFVFGGLLVITIIFGSVALISNQKIGQLAKEEANCMATGNSLGIKCTTVDELESKLVKKNESLSILNNNLQGAWVLLKEKLELKSKSYDKGLDEASSQISILTDELDSNSYEEYDKEELEDCRKRLKSISDEFEKKGDQMDDHRSKLRDFHSEFNELNIREYIQDASELVIDNLDSLSRAIPLLDEFVERINGAAETARTAIVVFEQILDEESTKISDLFEKDGYASDIFSEVTKGRYSGVYYDQIQNSLYVSRPDGEQLPVNLLSKGATDQLYLSIRFALAKKLLKDQRCFFIFDDALLSSDKSRLENQVEILNELANDNWQVIYFTSKDDTYRTIRKLNSARLTKLQSLP